MFSLIRTYAKKCFEITVAVSSMGLTMATTSIAGSLNDIPARPIFLPSEPVYGSTVPPMGYAEFCSRG